MNTPDTLPCPICLAALPVMVFGGWWQIWCGACRIVSTRWTESGIPYCNVEKIQYEAMPPTQKRSRIVFADPTRDIGFVLRELNERGYGELTGGGVYRL